METFMGGNIREFVSGFKNESPAQDLQLERLRVVYVCHLSSNYDHLFFPPGESTTLLSFSSSDEDSSTFSNTKANVKIFYSKAPTTWHVLKHVIIDLHKDRLPTFPFTATDIHVSGNSTPTSAPDQPARKKIRLLPTKSRRIVVKRTKTAKPSARSFPLCKVYTFSLSVFTCLYMYISMIMLLLKYLDLKF
ncbi:hypothetical protein L1887_34638 [Cichorium endivia]|nr:hypothetical protein L1887_34638 [Cichorium endivia]